MLKLNTLKSPKGAHKNTKRLGRGHASGQGQQAGKGHKGQKARSGGGVRLGFEGGQMPLYRRLPKRGFKNAPFKKVFSIISLSDLDKKFDNEVVNRESLIAKGMLKGINKRLPIKILANGDVGKSLTFQGISNFSKRAKEAIEKTGGKIEISEEVIESSKTSKE